MYDRLINMKSCFTLPKTVKSQNFQNFQNSTKNTNRMADGGDDSGSVDEGQHTNRERYSSTINRNSAQKNSAPCKSQQIFVRQVKFPPVMKGKLHEYLVEKVPFFEN